MDSVWRIAARIAATTISVLLLGETGSGKELMADRIHKASRRAQAPFVRVNCAGLTESLVESELFGHERGAFSGAVSSHQGLFEAADGGTLFLDEIGELPLRTQAKLLRVLESGEFSRVGSTQLRRADTRVIAATHRDLPRLVEQAEFRQDLYFRLNGLTLEIPPLRERRSEIHGLATLFLKRSAEQLERPELRLDRDAIEALERYAWPGNIRELRSAIERAAAICSGPTVTAEQLALGGARQPRSVPSPNEPVRPHAPTPSRDLRSSLRVYERDQILAALHHTGGNQTRAAKVLGFSRRTLTNKLNQHGMPRPRKRSS